MYEFYKRLIDDKLMHPEDWEDLIFNEEINENMVIDLVLYGRRLYYECRNR